MKRFFHIVGLLTLVLLLCTDAALAQPKPRKWPPVIPDQQHVFEQLPDDMKDEILKDAEYAVNLCEKHQTFSVFQDCDCIGMKIIDARITSGPDMPVNNLLHMVSRLCTNKPAITGFYYDRCHVQAMQYNISEPERKEYCLCVGKKVADTYALYPHNSVRYKANIFANANIDCGLPEYVRREAQEFDLRRAAEKNMIP